jgi:hypothetical protein
MVRIPGTLCQAGKIVADWRQILLNRLRCMSVWILARCGGGTAAITRSLRLQ